MVAAYAFALQALLGAVLVSQTALAASDPFVICYASDDGTPADHGGGKPQAHDVCSLCTLAKVSHAILGADHATLPVEFAFSAVLLSAAIERIVPFHSPTGQYQRGPPAVVFAV